MQLAVVLVNWRNTTQTIRCAAALKRWDRLRPTVIIVDNQSADDSRTALQGARVADRIIPSPVNRGYGGGNNLGIAAARDVGSAILLLNSDVGISEAMTSQLLARLDADPKLSVVGPLLVEPDGGRARTYAGGRNIARYARTRVPVDASRLAALPGYPLMDVDYVPGTVFLARGSVFDDVGLLDEDYFFSGEIADFCKRARDKGHKLRVDLEARAQHERETGDGDLRDTLNAYYSLRNRLLYVRKHHAEEKLLFFGFWSMVAIRGAAAASLRGRFGRARAIVLAWADGVTGRYGNQNAKFI